MPHIDMPKLPGILAPFAYAPEVAHAMGVLAETLLRGESPLTVAEREIIATVVSHVNGTRFCKGSHGACASQLAGRERVQRAIRGQEQDPKLHALLVIAAKLTRDPQGVGAQLVHKAKLAGATDRMIHDTVAIAAAFNMYNRYVDGLATEVPPEGYDDMGVELAKNGYMRGTKEG